MTIFRDRRPGPPWLDTLAAILAHLAGGGVLALIIIILWKLIR